MKSRELIEYFEQKQEAKSGNYFTDGIGLYLFGNKIAEHRDDGIYFTLAGYNTVTTKKALNYLTGVSVSSRNGLIKNCDTIIESDVWYKVNSF